MNRPRTLEGVQVWDLALRVSGQLRVAGLGGVIGLDLGAALAMAAALGIDGMAVAELLPAIETRLVQALNKRDGASGGDREVIGAPE